MEGFGGSHYNTQRGGRHVGLTKTNATFQSDHWSQASRSPSNTSGSVRCRLRDGSCHLMLLGSV